MTPADQAGAGDGKLELSHDWSGIGHSRNWSGIVTVKEDHALVRTGPYALVRHPIYASLLAMLAATLLAFTRGWWPVLALVLYIAGTEIRVHTEDRLLHSRFGREFELYRSRVPAYLPFVR